LTLLEMEHCDLRHSAGAHRSSSCVTPGASWSCAFRSG
jgi:hypothetical protein